MKESTAEIEAIVQVVLQRLGVPPARSANAGNDGSPSAAKAQLVTQATHTSSGDSARSGVLRVCHPVVSMESVAGKLNGLHTLEVSNRAVVTPAVADELRSRKVRLVRLTRSQQSASSGQPHQRGLLVVASASWQTHARTVGEFACTSQNASADVCRIAAHLNSGGLAVIWSTDTPFAAMRASSVNSTLRAILLPSLDDVARGVREAEPNVMILDQQRWDGESLVQLAGDWMRSVK